MTELAVTEKNKFSTENLILAGKYLLKNWYMLVLAVITSALIGYFFVKRLKPTYTATINFVLSSEQKPSSISGLATQMGFDMGGGPDNIFSGDNIIDFFKSRALIGKALLSVTDTAKQETLVNLILRKHYSDSIKTYGFLGANPEKYSSRQTQLYRSIITLVSREFVVLKKDKKLIFYLINATDTDPDVAFYIAKNMLGQTSRYFIDTKTKVRRESVRLMKHEADSLSQVLSSTYASSASVTDRTYNLNPSISVQRSSISFIQSKSTALGLAYQQVMQNLENGKMSLQQETPLYRIIDMPELPLTGVRPSTIMHIVITSILGVMLMCGFLFIDFMYLKNI